MKKRLFSHWIRVVGAREHNLKNIDVAIPKDTLTIVTGPSGSGKSSLALDILFAEGKRRYMESLSSYARQFLGVAKKPDVERIDGLCPAIAIEQKTVSANPRSTVGTITEIYDYLRVLFARIGVVHCAECGNKVKPESAQMITELVLRDFKDNDVLIAAPIARERKGEFVHQLEELFQAGLYRFIIDGQQYRFRSLDDIKALKLKKTFKHSIDLLIDMVQVIEPEQSRIQEAIEIAFKYAKGLCKIIVGMQEHLYSLHAMCVNCGTAVAEIEPRLFSFNSPIGACPTCHGLGVIHHWGWEPSGQHMFAAVHRDLGYIEKVCPACHGKRLNNQALAVTVGDHDIYQIGEKSVGACIQFFNTLTLDERAQEIAYTIICEIVNRLMFLDNVGLDYLTLNRAAQTLSGGEGQRIRLATQIGSALSGVVYILDEPSIGLHQRDNDRLIATLKSLRDYGNTVVVVEHDIDTIRASDYVIDMGPAAGVLGGQITAVGTPHELAQNPASLTGMYLSGKREISVPNKQRKPQGFMTLHQASKNNLDNLTVSFPLGVMCGVSGVSGSGKSTLIMQELVPAIHQELGGYARSHKNARPHERLTGAQDIQSIVVIDQTPIGRTPRSNPATYLGIFDDIRKLYASLPESNARGYTVGRFSFNVDQGRCFECKGEGTITVEMHFLPEVVMICKSCKGKRYNNETLQILYKGKSIADVLEMTAFEAREFFAAHSTIAKRLNVLCEVGLDYIALGQPSTTLSGGEAQRIKLVDELAKRGSNTIYILDEPTTGLHTSDIEKLLAVLNRLVDKQNSMIIIEHNLDVLKTVDYVIDLGPEGGVRGGTVVAQGTPEQVAHASGSYTGMYLKQFFKQ